MNITFSKDLLERVLSTFIGGFIAALSLSWAGSGIDAAHLTDWSAWQHLLYAAVLAGGAAVVSLIKGLVAKNVGDTGSASLAASASPAAVDPITTVAVDTAVPDAETPHADLAVTPIDAPAPGTPAV